MREHGTAVPATAPTSADPVTAAEQALDDAVLNYLKVTGQIPAAREIVALDYGVPFTAKYVTSGGRTARRTGCIIPPHVENVPALGDMMFRRCQQLRHVDDEIRDMTRPPRPARPSSKQRHQRLPECVSDHTKTERCWWHVGSYMHTTGTASLDVWAHMSSRAERERAFQLPLSMRETSAMRFEVTEWTPDGPVRTWSDLTVSEAYHFGEDVLHAAERMTWAGLTP